MPPKLIAPSHQGTSFGVPRPATRVAFIIPPIMQVFLYAYAATLDVTNVAHRRLQRGLGQSSRQLVSRFEQASAFSDDHLFQEREGNPARDRQPEHTGQSVRIRAEFFAEGGGARAGWRAGAFGWAKVQQRTNPQWLHQQHRRELRRRCRPGRGAARSQPGVWTAPGSTRTGSIETRWCRALWARSP